MHEFEFWPFQLALSLNKTLEIDIGLFLRTTTELKFELQWDLLRIDSEEATHYHCHLIWCVYIKGHVEPIQKIKAMLCVLEGILFVDTVDTSCQQAML